MKVEFMPGIKSISGSTKPRMGKRLVFRHYKSDKPAIGQPPESIFLHGAPLYKAMNDHIPLVQVDIPDRPEGRYPVCTRENAERYGLTISSIIP